MGYATTLTLHLLSAVIWVGGMFFAYMALRPAAVRTLEPSQRLPLWAATFQRFFPWVWAAILVLPATGYWMIFVELADVAGHRLYVDIMQGIGFVMIAIFLHVFFAPFQRLNRAVAAQDWQAAGHQLNQIRMLVLLNLILGICTIIVAVSGPSWS
ncbi:MAG: CopD family protein [Acidiferrobacteraceae bacterium]|jgi:uncharacterized membrane protein